jgi:Na+-transporting methylmalonyl-CoA/oxaloacetate decarboxylase beta subunit
MSLAFRKGDDFSTLVDFNGTTLVGCTASAGLYSTVTGALVQSMETTIADAATGQVSVSLTDTQTAGLVAGTYNWRLDWVAPGSVQRNALAGTAEVYA